MKSVIAETNAVMAKGNVMSKSTVALVKGEDIQANVTKVFDLLGGVENVIRPGTTVMIKPNAGHAEPPETSGGSRQKAGTGQKRRSGLPGQQTAARAVQRSDFHRRERYRGSKGCR